MKSIKFGANLKYLSIFLLLLSSNYVLAASSYEDSIIGTVIQFIIDLFGGLYQLATAVGVFVGFWFVITGFMDKTMESRNEEGWVKKVGGGFAIAAVCGGLLASTLNDSGAASGQGFEGGSFLNSSSSSSTTSGTSGGTD